MHLAEGATPGSHPSLADDKLLQFSNSVTSQQSQREQVPIQIPSSQVASAQPPLQTHASMTSSANSGNPSSLGPSKSAIHDPGAMSVRYKVITCQVLFNQLD